ncbi:hypothetical protein T4B_102 [Trichinella pseudospiralis]|uniref:Uncharacterized protein n=2 Tax=Trichinella pseudospiralis TaxID=6337 RepID=A0A0V1GR48_TRIPS|nr:hypothetical protein T4B_102 [Trichinella pseudospiralis]
MKLNRSTRSNGIENEHAQWQSWNSPSFFTVKNFNKELNVQNETIESVEASWSPFDPRYENICCMPFRHLQMKFMNTSELFEQLRRVVYLSLLYDHNTIVSGLYYRHTQSCLQSSLNPASYAIGALGKYTLGKYQVVLSYTYQKYVLPFLSLSKYLPRTYRLYTYLSHHLLEAEFSDKLADEDSATRNGMH